MPPGAPVSSVQHPSPALDRAALTARLTTVLQFARINLARIDRHAPFWPNEKGSLVTQADKVVVETALLALLASRVSSPGRALADELAHLVAQIAPLARSETNRVRLLRFPQTAASIGMAHICLSRLGDRDESFEALIRSALSSGHVDAIERLPYRSMDVTWLRTIYDPAAVPDFDGLIRYSILGSCAHPVYMADVDAYAVTHAVMYLTDFGGRTLPASISRERVAAMLDACLAWHILAANMDLLGELLIATTLVGGSWSPYAWLAIRMFTSLFDEFGFLPSAAFDSARYRELAGHEASAYAFRHVYHSTYVAGILFQALLSHLDRPPTDQSWVSLAEPPASLLSECERAIAAAQRFCGRVDGRSVRKTRSATDGVRSTPSTDVRSPISADAFLEKTVARIRSYPGVCGREGAPWRDAVAATRGLPDPGDLGLVLSDALLIQAARDYNLSVLAATLVDRATSGLPLSRTLFEATAFLTRQQLHSGAIGAYFVVPENCLSPQASDITAVFANCLMKLTTYIRRSASPDSSPVMPAHTRPNI